MDIIFSLVFLYFVLPKGVFRGDMLTIFECDPLSYFIVYSDHPLKFRHVCFKL